VGYETAITILKKHKKQLEHITKELVEKETLEGEEFEELMKNS
jgi:ATP-dependent Zn protease